MNRLVRFVETIFPNSFINSQIRPPLAKRIRRFKLILGQELSHLSLVWLLVGLILTATRTQKELDAFLDHSDDVYGDEDSDPGKSQNQNNGDESDPEKKALIYARVSGHSQIPSSDDDTERNDSQDTDGTNTEDVEHEDGYAEGSIKAQVDELDQLRKKEDLELAHPPITDEAETGTDFDREGIQKVFRLAKRSDVGYLFVEKIDRIGRSAAETLYFIHVLQKKCEVRLMTPSGERDIDKIQGLMHTTLLSLMAEVQNDIRTTKAKKQRVRNFVIDQNWTSYTHIIPLGYELTDDGWLEPDAGEEDIVRDLFETFNDPDCQMYSKTDKKISNEYGDILDGHRVKTILTNPVYVGRPQVPKEWVVDLEYDNVVEDPDLQIIDEETFERTQEIIERKNQKHSTDSETREIGDFVEEFDLFTVIASSDPVKLIHDCGEQMVKNGQRTVDGEIKTHLYKCPECGESRKWPQNLEYERMNLTYKLLNDDISFLDAVAEALCEKTN